MRYLGHFIVRLVVVLFGIFAAMLAASIFLSFGTLGGMFTQFFADLEYVFEGEIQNSEPLLVFVVVLSGFFSSFYIASLAVLPTLIAIAIAELMRWQGMTINLVLGGLVGLFTGLTRLAAVYGSTYPSDGTLVVLLAAGFIGGFFYWLIAGRSAGRWMGESEEVTQ